MYKLLPPKLFQCKNPLFPCVVDELEEVKALFKMAVKESEILNAASNKKTILKLFALYKQATEGDINISKPDSSEDKAALSKYNAWLLLKGKTRNAAQQEFIVLVNKLGKN